MATLHPPSNALLEFMRSSSSSSLSLLITSLSSMADRPHPQPCLGPCRKSAPKQREKKKKKAFPTKLGQHVISPVGRLKFVGQLQAVILLLIPLQHHYSNTNTTLPQKKHRPNSNSQSQSLDKGYSFQQSLLKLSLKLYWTPHSHPPPSKSTSEKLLTLSHPQ